MSTIQRMLVPVDFSDASRAALRQAATLAKALAARVDILHVWEPAPNVTPVQLGWMAGDANAFCGSLEADLRERVQAMADEELGEAAEGAEVLVEAGYVAHSILERLENQAYGMVIMGTHGRRGLSHLVLGSVAERIVRAAPCPVLTIRAATDAAEKDEGEEPSADLETPTHV